MSFSIIKNIFKKVYPIVCCQHSSNSIISSNTRETEMKSIIGERFGQDYF